MTIHSPIPTRQRLSTLALALALAPIAACSADPDADGEDSNEQVERPDGAILIAERFNTPDGRVMYMKAVAELPSAPVDISTMVELGPGGDVFGCGGNAFFYNSDAGSITKYEVGDDLSLTRRQSIDVGLEGIVGWTGAHVCASATQAFIFHESGGRVVEFNPETMVLVDAFDVPTPDVGEDMYVQLFEAKVAGDLVYFSVTAINWDTLAVEPRSILAVFEISTKTLTLDYDDRCQASLGGFVDSAGNYWQTPEDGGFWASFSPTPDLPPDCVLRVNAGSKTYDDSYVQPLADGQSLRAMWPIDDDWQLATLIDMSQAPSEEDLWEWYDLPITPTAVNVVTGEQVPYTSVPNVQPMNSRKLVLDGDSYYQVYNFDGDGRVSAVDVVRLTPDGAEPAFTLVGGDILTLERLW
jgi:hypothetical protein